MIPKSLDDKFNHGEFKGMTVREVMEKNPRMILKMSNRNEVQLSRAEIEEVKRNIL